jgi:hypothetical protein
MDTESKALRFRMFCAFYTNIGVTIAIISIVLAFNDTESLYLRYGWHEDLAILGIKINTGYRYVCLLLLLGLLEAIDVFINDTIFPYVNNNVRDNNVKHIKEFTRHEIQLLTNGSFFLSTVKYQLYVMISISQIDIALIRALIGETACIFTTNIQLNGKTFMNNPYAEVSTEEEGIEVSAMPMPKNTTSIV